MLFSEEHWKKDYYFATISQMWFYVKWKSAHQAHKLYG